jgi:hypothetical protein
MEFASGSAYVAMSTAQMMAWYHPDAVNRLMIVSGFSGLAAGFLVGSMVAKALGADRVAILKASLIGFAAMLVLPGVMPAFWLGSFATHLIILITAISAELAKKP